MVERYIRSERFEDSLKLRKGYSLEYYFLKFISTVLMGSAMRSTIASPKHIQLATVAYRNCMSNYLTLRRLVEQKSIMSHYDVLFILVWRILLAEYNRLIIRLKVTALDYLSIMVNYGRNIAK